MPKSIFVEIPATEHAQMLAAPLVASGFPSVLSRVTGASGYSRPCLGTQWLRYRRARLASPRVGRS
jgi:hypothetical protein